MQLRLFTVAAALALPSIANSAIITTTYFRPTEPVEGLLPTEIRCGTERHYLLTVVGTAPAQGGDVYLSFWDEDDSIFDPFDDLLVPDMLRGAPEGPFELTFTVTFGCTPEPECMFYGVSESGTRYPSGEGSIQMYWTARFEPGSETFESDRVPMSCVPSPGAGVFALAGLAAAVRKRRR